MGGSVSGNFGNTKGSRLDALSDFLTAASLIPGIDTLADLAAIPVDLLRGDFLSAGLDAFGVFPFIGEIADTSKLAKMADKALDGVKVANKGADASKTIRKITPSQLTQTQKLTMSRRQYDNLVNSIKKNGIIESIKYVEHKGTKYVVDGHHRLSAAKKLKIDKVPIEKVSLPYKGYKTVEDLLWFD